MAGGYNEAPRGLLENSGRRKSFIEILIDLYQSDLAFRGMTDFAVIGSVVMMFLHPPASLPWSGGGGQPSNIIQGGGGSPGGNGSTQAGAGQTGGAVTTAPAAPVVAIDFPGGFVNPTLDGGFLFDIDAAAIRSSSLAVQPLLEAARAALMNNDGAAAMSALSTADANDPNVALLRGFAALLHSTADGNRLAEAFWRTAVNAGHREAPALLGRLLLTKRAGATQDAKEGQRLIEAGVASGDRRAMRYAGIAHLGGEFGAFQPAKGAELLKRAVDAGDVPAMMFYAALVARGGVTGPANHQIAEKYVRAAAEAGLTTAQYTLGVQLMSLYQKGLSPDPAEAIRWLTLAYERGHHVDALNDLNALHSNEPRKAPWYDPNRGFALSRKCSGFEIAVCQSNTGVGWENGNYGQANLIIARAHYGIAARLGDARAADNVKRLDVSLNDAEKQRARALEIAIGTSLKPKPKLIALQLSGVPIPKPPELVARYTDVSTGSSSTTSATRGSEQGTAGPWPKEAEAPRSTCVDENAAAGPRQTACELVLKNGWYDKTLEYEILANLAWSKTLLGKHKDALSDYDRAIALNPKNPYYFNNRGISKEALRDWLGALRDYDAALAIEPGQVYAGANRARALMNLGRHTEAIAAATEALALRPNSTIALRSRARSYMLTGNNALALADFDEAVRLGDTDIDTFIGRGYVHFKRGSAGYDQALADFARAMQLGNPPAEVHLYRGWIFKARNQTGAAMAAADAAIKISPKHIESRLLKGRLLIEANQAPEAIMVLRSLLQEAADNPDAHYLFGRAQTTLFVDALRVCEQVKADKARGKVNPDYAAIGSGSLVDTRCMIEPDPDTSLKSLQRAIEINPKHEDVYFQMGRVYEGLKQWGAAAEAFGAEIVNAPSNECYRRRANARFALRSFQEAIQDYTEAIRLKQQDHVSFYSRGLSYSRLGNRQAAVADFRKALNIERDYKPAIDALVSMGERP